MSIIPFLLTSDPVVTQDELSALIGMRNHIHFLEKLYGRQAQEVIDRISRGSRVEPGGHYVELRTRSRGRRRITTLVVE